MAKRIVGLDVGFSTLRAAQVNFSYKGVPVVEKIAEIRLPEGMVDFGEIRDRNGFSELLNRFWAEHRFATKHVALAAGSLHVFARELSLPLMSMQRIKESLPFMMEGILPVPAEQLYIDFYGAEESSDEHGPVMHGLAVAAERSGVDTLVDCVVAAHLRPVSVDFIPFALTRVHLNPKSPDDLILLIDVGAGATNVVIAKGAVPQFVRVIPNGGQDVDRALMFNLKLTATEAAETKLRLKKPPRNKEDLKAWQVMQEVIEDFLTTVKNTLDYYQQSHASETKEITQITLSGGGAHLGGLLEAVQNEFKVPTALNGTLAHIEQHKDLKEDVAAMNRMAIAIGIALGGNE